MTKTLLVINPNSTASITESLKLILAPLVSSNFELHYYTGPPEAPPSINDNETAAASTAACLPSLLPELDRHAGFLVACYSEHPLVYELRKYTMKPILGIFEASITHAMMLRGSSGWGIITTGKAWEDLLSIGVGNIVGEDCSGFEGVESTGLNADELHNVGHDELTDRVRDAVIRLVQRGADVRVICLGCAGMAGFDSMVQGVLNPLHRTAFIVDGVKAGIVQLEGLVKCNYNLVG